MASNYSIISAHSPDGANINVPVGWVVNNPESDLLVYISGNGSVGVCNSWIFDSENSVVKITNSNGFAAYSVFVFRVESAAMLEDLIADRKVAVSSILAQLAKNVRCLEQAEESQKTAIRAPSKIDGILPDVAGRAGKLLSFDSDGKPQTVLGCTDYENVKAYKIAAEKSAQDASTAAEKAEAQADKVSEVYDDSVALLNECTEAKENASAAAGAAVSAAENAASSATEAGESATSAAENAVAASNAASAAASAAGSADYAASSAESDKTAAESAQTAAQAAATQAASDKTTTETYKNAAESAKNAAELAKAEAQEISDPENRIGNLQILKRNGGQLYLNGGYATTNCKPTFGAAQSLLFTYEVSEAELETTPWMIIGNVRIWDSKKGIGFAKNSAKQIQCGFNWGYGQNGDTTSRAFLTATTAQFADGKPHAWALVCGKNATNGFFELYRDGVLIDSKMSLALFDDFIPEYGFSFGKHQTSGATDKSAKGRLSRIAFFNFDVSESNADYTLADYQSGKSIPPSLNLMTPQELLALKESDVASLQYYTYRADDIQYTGVWEDGYFVLKTTAETTITDALKGTFSVYPYYVLSAKIPAGVQIEVSFDDWIFNTTYFNQSSEIPDSNPLNARYYGWLTVGIDRADVNHGEVRSDKNFKFTTSKTFQRLYLMNYNIGIKGNVGDTIPANTVIYKVKGLKIKANGASLNLENYTIARNTTTRLIKDLSAGGYDATITGNIAGDMDRRVEVFVDELKTQIAQSTTTTD